jgi:hypothetical protein
MFIAKSHPMRQQMLRAETGVFGTYTLAVVGVVCSVVTAALFFDPTVSPEAAVAAAFGDAGPPFMDVTPPRAPGTEQSASAPAAPPAVAAPEAPTDINGLDLPADYPLHNQSEETWIDDEAAAVAVYMW